MALNLHRMAAISGVGILWILLAHSAMAQLSSFNIREIDGRNGFNITDGVYLDDFRPAVSRTTGFIGDINNDGIDDVLLSNPGNDQQGLEAGAVAVVFGRENGFGAGISIDDLNGSNGFILVGNMGTRLGNFVGTAGDVNHDGIDDLLVTTTRGGQAYVLYGSDSAFPAQMTINNINAEQGFVVTVRNQTNGDAGTPQSARLAGDVNADGIDDLIFGVPELIDNSVSGAYVLYGQDGNFDPNINLFELDGSNGFALDSLSIVNDTAVGSSVSAAGDLNNDGIDDLVLSNVFGSTAGGVSNGAAYVVFGRSDGFPARFDLGTLNGSNGFELIGVGTFNGFGHSLASVGDINQDGIDDLGLGAYRFNGSNVQTGRAYVLFGREDGFAPSLEVESIPVGQGFVITTDIVRSRLGSGISSAGDFNRDGMNDLIIGAPSSIGAIGLQGRVYILYGRAGDYPQRLSLEQLTEDAGVVIVGNPDDRLGVSVDRAGDVNHDGFDDVVISANGAVNVDDRTVNIRHHVLFNDSTTVIFGDGFEA